MEPTGVRCQLLLPPSYKVRHTATGDDSPNSDDPPASSSSPLETPLRSRSAPPLGIDSLRPSVNKRPAHTSISNLGPPAGVQLFPSPRTRCSSPFPPARTRDRNPERMFADAPDDYIYQPSKLTSVLAAVTLPIWAFIAFVKYLLQQRIAPDKIQKAYDTMELLGNGQRKPSSEILKSTKSLLSILERLLNYEQVGRSFWQIFKTPFVGLKIEEQAKTLAFAIYRTLRDRVEDTSLCHQFPFPEACSNRPELTEFLSKARIPILRRSTEFALMLSQVAESIGNREEESAKNTFLFNFLPKQRIDPEHDLWQASDIEEQLRAIIRTFSQETRRRIQDELIRIPNRSEIYRILRREITRST